MADPLDPELLLEITKRAKKQLRRRLRELRRSYPGSVLAGRSQLIVSRLAELPAVKAAGGVALFHPMLERGEVDLRTLDQLLRSQGVRVYYPFMSPSPSGGFSTGFRLTDGLEDLSERGRGFLEPKEDAPVAGRGDVDVVVVPALAADGRGHRLGYGSGFYDATLADVVPPALAVVVVFEFQLLAEIPSEAHDVPCNWVITEKRTLDVQGLVPTQRV